MVYFKNCDRLWPWFPLGAIMFKDPYINYLTILGMLNSIHQCRKANYSVWTSLFKSNSNYKVFRVIHARWLIMVSALACLDRATKISFNSETYLLAIKIRCLGTWAWPKLSLTCSFSLLKWRQAAFQTGLIWFPLFFFVSQPIIVSVSQPRHTLNKIAFLIKRIPLTTLDFNCNA